MITDAAAIAEIYNQGITDRIATFEIEPRSATDIVGWFTGAAPARSTLTRPSG
jgi:L-amino acid N-acyltransferase YncA